MKLSEFSTLAAAQAYTVTGSKMMSADLMLSYVAQFNLIDALIDNPVTNEAKAVRAAFNFGSEFNFINNHPASVVSGLDVLISASIVPASLKVAVVAYANPVTRPYFSTTQAEWNARDVEEVLAMVNNNAQHTTTLSIATRPTKRINVKIEQRFGSSTSNLTPWHECATFIGVDFTQQTYRASNIPASPAAYRELRAVSGQTIGMSVS